MQPRVGFRVDWSHALGLGHLQRCLSLADALGRYGIGSTLVARSSPTTGPPAADVAVRWLDGPWRLARRDPGGLQRPDDDRQQSVDASQSVAQLQGRSLGAVVVDAYALDSCWESQVGRELDIPVVAIDGLANRRHTASLVVDPTLVVGGDRWTGGVGPSTRVLGGPRYAPVAPGFAEYVDRAHPRDGTVRRVLVSFGGSDPHRLTERALDALVAVRDRALLVDVVVGAAHHDPDRVRQRCSRSSDLTFHHATSEMPSLMAAADLAIGAGGITSYERAFLGLPALVAVAAPNQAVQVQALERAGVVRSLGDVADLRAEDILVALHALLDAPDALRAMSRAARRLMGNDVLPGSMRVADELVQLLDRGGGCRA